MIRDSIQTAIVQIIVDMVEANPNPPVTYNIRIAADGSDRIAADGSQRIAP